MSSNTSGVSSSADIDSIAIDDPQLGRYNYRALNNMMGDNATMFNMTPGSTDYNQSEAGFGHLEGRIDPRDPDSNISPPTMNIEGQFQTPQMKPDLGGQTELQTAFQSQVPVGPTSPLQQIANQGKDDMALAIKRNNQVEGARAGAALLRATGGVINANSKYTQVVSQNNYNIHLAEIQEAQVASTSAYNQLREVDKGKSRADNSRLSAVAQGQSATGDLANTQASNEEVYAAQNAMNLQINSMRTIFGIQSQERQLHSANVSAGITHDEEIFQAVLQGVQGIGTSAMGVMKGGKADLSGMDNSGETL